jgi:DNA-binding protein H-NS
MIDIEGEGMPEFNLQEKGPEFRGTMGGRENQKLELNTRTVVEPEKLELNSMSIDDLFDLRDRITKMLLDRVQSEQRELESRLARLCDVNSTNINTISPRRQPDRPSRLRGRKIPPKYRNPADPSETWAGRGRLPRWLAAAIDKGKRMADFEITDATKTRRRARKTAK